MQNEIHQSIDQIFFSNLQKQNLDFYQKSMCVVSWAHTHMVEFFGSHTHAPRPRKIDMMLNCRHQ